MSKDDKFKISEKRKLEPENKLSKGKPNKKKFPPHWEIRDGYVSPSKCLKTDTSWRRKEIVLNGHKGYTTSDELRKIYDLVKKKILDEALAIYAKYHPETTEWPVRFINIPPMKTNREVL